MLEIFNKFLNWFKIKIRLKTLDKRPLFNEREIWWRHFGENIGDEENGKGNNFNRPVLIIKKFNRNLALVIPTSRQIKDNPYYIPINYKNKQYSALISHLRVINTLRMTNKITRLEYNEFLTVVQAVIDFLPKN